MTKIMPIGTIAHGLRQVMQLLGEQGVERAIGTALGVRRSASLIRKCADPDGGRHHLQMRYAIALDRACLARGHAAPLLEAYRAGLEGVTGDPAPAGSKDELIRAVVVLQAALGDVSRAVEAAFSSRSADPSALTRAERSHVYAAVDLVETDARLIKRMLVERACQPEGDAARDSR